MLLIIVPAQFYLFSQSYIEAAGTCVCLTKQQSIAQFFYGHAAAPLSHRPSQRVRSLSTSLCCPSHAPCACAGGAHRAGALAGRRSYSRPRGGCIGGRRRQVWSSFSTKCACSPSQVLQVGLPRRPTSIYITADAGRQMQSPEKEKETDLPGGCAAAGGSAER